MPSNPYDLNTRYSDVMAGFLAESRRSLLGSLARIEHCLGQLSEEQVWWRLKPEMNAVGNLLLHLTGNVGQWIVAAVEDTDSGRNRPGEFAERGPIAKAALQGRLRMTVERAVAALGTIKTAEQLLAPRRIQGHDTCVLTAVYHGVAHFEGHAQEIIGMTRQMLGERYVFLWSPRTPEQVSAIRSGT